MNDIQLIDEKYYSCFQVAIATYLKNNNFVEYWCAFPNCWTFDYVRNEHGLLGHKIKTLWMSDISEIEEYTGVVLECVSKIDDKVYLVEMDVYNCWWSKVYKKYHMSHFFLLYKNFQKDTVVIVDSFFKKKIEIKERDINISDCKKIYKISIGNGSSLCVENVIRMARENMFPQESSDTRYKKMRDLAVDIIKCDYFSDIKNSNYDFYMNPLYNNLFRGEAGRYNFFRIISNDVKMRNSELFFVFEQIISCWEILRLNISRLLLTDNTDLLKKISNSLNELSYKEENALKKLCQLYNVDIYV